MDDWAHIITTLPYPLPSSVDRTPTLTSRLLIRPLAASDLEGFHSLASNHEVMKWTAAGRIHTNHEETRKKLNEFLPPNDTKTFNCAICLRDTGEFVGIGGVHQFSRVEDKGRSSTANTHNGYGWPELGYLMKQEYWGKGLATEFVMAFLSIWEQLHRASVEMKVNIKSLMDGGDGGDGASAPASASAKEALIAIVDRTNIASQRILQKCGFERFDDFTERNGDDPEKTAELISFRYHPTQRSQLERSELVNLVV